MGTESRHCFCTSANIKASGTGLGSHTQQLYLNKQINKLLYVRLSQPLISSAGLNSNKTTWLLKRPGRGKLEVERRKMSFWILTPVSPKNRPCGSFLLTQPQDWPFSRDFKFVCSCFPYEEGEQNRHSLPAVYSTATPRGNSPFT